MKKRYFSLLLAIGLAFGLMVPAYADHYDGESDWLVTFDGTKMDQNFKSSEMADAVLNKVQPGDDITFTVSLRNDYTKATDWWMKNEVLDNFEDAVAAGGAYSYKLQYIDPDGNTSVLYDSETVGGDVGTSDNREGLKEATGALEDYFYLDTLRHGETGKVTLDIEVEGQTEGNDYQDTLAQLMMKFAVEINEEEPAEPENTPSTPPTPTNPTPSNPTPSSPTPTTPTARTTYPTTPTPVSTTSRNAVRTGDEMDLVPYLIAAGVSGLLLLVIAMFRLKKNQKKQ